MTIADGDLTHDGARGVLGKDPAELGVADPIAIGAQHFGALLGRVGEGGGGLDVAGGKVLEDLLRY